MTQNEQTIAQALANAAAAIALAQQVFTSEGSAQGLRTPEPAPAARRRASGKQRKGTEHFRAKLTDATVIDVLGRLARGETQQAVAGDLGASQPTIGAIARGVTWKHIPRTPATPAEQIA